MSKKNYLPHIESSVKLVSELLKYIAESVYGDSIPPQFDRCKEEYLRFASGAIFDLKKQIEEEKSTTD